MAQLTNTGSSKWHVFSVEWRGPGHTDSLGTLLPNGGYVFRIDGEVVLRPRKAVSNTPEYLLLSQLVSDYENRTFQNTGAAGQSEVTKVDWVRVWQNM